MSEDTRQDEAPDRPPGNHGGPAGLGQRLLAVPFLLGALILLGAGGWLANAPGETGGPGAMDFSNPVGAAALLCGATILALLPAGWQRIGWALGGVAAAAPTLWSAWRFPPLADGILYAAYTGVPDPSSIPAGPCWVVLGLSPLALALALTVPAAPRRRWVVLGAAAFMTVIACQAYEVFHDAGREMLALGPRRLLVVLPAAALALAALRWRHAILPRTAGAYALMVLGLCLLSLWQEHIAFGRIGLLVR